MSDADLELRRFAARMARELSVACETVIGDRHVRVTVVVAVPAASGGPQDAIVGCAGNATAALTVGMLRAAIANHERGRVDREEGGAPKA
jgi:hypothetical protein